LHSTGRYLIARRPTREESLMPASRYLSVEVEANSLDCLSTAAILDISAPIPNKVHIVNFVRCLDSFGSNNNSAAVYFPTTEKIGLQSLILCSHHGRDCCFKRSYFIVIFPSKSVLDQKLYALRFFEKERELNSGLVVRVQILRANLSLTSEDPLITCEFKHSASGVFRDESLKVL